MGELQYSLHLLKNPKIAIKRLGEYRKKSRYKNFGDNYKSITNNIVKDRWNGDYLEAGQEVHLSSFWVRDLGWSTKGLINLGYKDRVKSSIEWAMDKFMKNGHLTTTISREGFCYDVDTYGADTLPFVLHIINEINEPDLLQKYKKFLNSEINYYYSLVYDPKLRMVNPLKLFSIPKDMIKIRNTTVANTFMLFLVKQLEGLKGFDNPFPDFDSLKKVFMKAFWRIDHFANDRGFKERVDSSDANIWPFWTGVVEDKYKLSQSLKWIQKLRFDRPLPIKYHNKNYDHLANFFSRIVVPNYQGNSIWTMNAPLYIELVNNVEPLYARQVLTRFVKSIESWHNYFEVLTPDGTGPLQGRLGFRSGSAMLWASLIPRLVEIVGLSEAS